MSKLLKLKSWVTISEAAEYLTAVASEDVSEADLLHLAIEGKLAIAVRFVNGAYVRPCTIADSDSIEWREVPSLIDGHEPVKIPLHGPYVMTIRGEFLRVENELVRIGDEPYDLSMMGSERLDIQDAYQRATGGPRVTAQGLEGVFLEQSGNYFQLQEHSSNGGKSEKGYSIGRWGDTADFHPAGGIGDEAVLVIRPSALSRFIATFLQDPKCEVTKGQADEKALSPREQTTYLNIIGALLDLMLSRSPAGTAHSVFASQAAIIDSILAHHPRKPGLSDTTLEMKFAAAKRSIGGM